MSSNAYLKTFDVCGHPETDRERQLFDALEAALSDHVHDECRERLKDAVDELAKADKARLHDAPEAEIELRDARRVLRERRQREPYVPPSGKGDLNVDRYERFIQDREATDLIEQLVEEVESYRKLAGVES